MGKTIFFSFIEYNLFYFDWCRLFKTFIVCVCSFNQLFFLTFTIEFPLSKFLADFFNSDRFYFYAGFRAEFAVFDRVFLLLKDITVFIILVKQEQSFIELALDFGKNFFILMNANFMNLFAFQQSKWYTKISLLYFKLLSL